MVNMNQIMKQAQAMQQKMSELEAEKEKKEFSGTSGGEMVKVTISGKNEVKEVKIDPSIVDKEEIEMLEDLIIAAFNEARKKLDEDSQSSMSDMMGGMKMPPGFKGF